MRQIKFRAWDGEKMTDAIRLDFVHGLRLISSSDLGFGMIGDDKCILMQFTGLLDKNGNEIYEGDVVEWGFSKIRKQIGFHNGSFIAGVALLGAIDLRDVSRVTLEDLYSEEPHKPDYRLNVEIIGNVHENPSLISDKK